MSSSEESGPSTPQKKYRGIRRRKWGKWVSEIRVPGTQDRLWLGSYSTPEAAAVAHDVASFHLRGPSSWDNFNFPHMLPADVQMDLSPRSVQQAASDAGLAIDAQLVTKKPAENDGIVNEISGVVRGQVREIREDVVHSSGTSWEGREPRGEALSISVEDYLYT